MKEIAKNVLYKILTLSLYLARKKQGYMILYKSLKKIIPDISDQYSSRIISGEYLTSKVYSQHAFQTQLVRKKKIIFWLIWATRVETILST